MILTSFKRPDHIPLYAEDLVWTHRLVGEFSSNNNHMTLQQQLEYFWERQVYSVLKDSNGKYCIVSTRNHDLGFRFSGFFPTIDIAKDYIGAFGRWENMAPDCTLERCTIVDTIHPSELMGKGFQVGDKVEVIFGVNSGRTGTVQGKTYQGTYFLKEFEFDSHYYKTRDLKPVLPVEEEKITVTHKSHICGCRVWDCESRSSGAKWFFANGSNEWIELMPNVEYAICSKCMKKINQCDVDAAVKLLKEKGIIKDGHIVNL